jgi:hypothetical protein
MRSPILSGKKILIMTLGCLVLCLMVAGLTACTLPASSTATTTQTVTQTVTATTTTTAATTSGSPPVTTTKPGTTTPAGSVPTATVTTTITVTLAPAPSPTQTGTDISATLQKNNNGHFLIGREIASYNRVLQSDGTYIETPVYRFVYYDYDLLSFTTNAGAIFVPRIPTFTDYDDWFVRFSTKSFLYPTPFKVNWAFITKSGNVSPKTSLRFYQGSYFDANYYKNPQNLALNNLGPDLAVDTNGVHFAELTLYDDLAALVRTDNPSDILGWWIKIGDVH